MQRAAIIQRSTAATWLLIFVCIFFYPTGLRSDYWACSYNSIFQQGRWWTVFTALFVHGSLGHLLGNMLFLLLFGRGLERYIGSPALLLVFFAGGAVSMLFSAFYYPPGEPCVGASGAISAILATLMLFNPWRLSILLTLFPMPLGVAGFTFLLLNVGGFMAARHGTDVAHVAYVGHLTGFVAGILFGMVLSPDWKRNLVACVLQFICFYFIVLAIIHYGHWRPW